MIVFQLVFVGEEVFVELVLVDREFPVPSFPVIIMECLIIGPALFVVRVVIILRRVRHIVLLRRRRGRVATIRRGGALLLWLVVRKKEPRRLRFLGVSRRKVALVVVGRRGWNLALNMLNILRLLATAARRRRGLLLSTALTVRVARIVGALGSIRIMSEAGSSRIAFKKVVAPRIGEVEVRRLGFVGRRWRRIGLCGRLDVACRIAARSGLLMVPLGLRQRRLRLIRVSVPAEVGKTATLPLVVPCALVLIGVCWRAITR